MTLYGLIAHPAAHSLSPIMQNEMMIARQINGHYHSFDIIPSDLESAVLGLRALHVGGFNLLAPQHQVREQRGHRDPLFPSVPSPPASAQPNAGEHHHRAAGAFCPRGRDVASASAPRSAPSPLLPTWQST